jgi:hypothetical protein
LLSGTVALSSIRLNGGLGDDGLRLIRSEEGDEYGIAVLNQTLQNQFVFLANFATPGRTVSDSQSPVARVQIGQVFWEDSNNLKDEKTCRNKPKPST